MPLSLASFFACRMMLPISFASTCVTIPPSMQMISISPTVYFEKGFRAPQKASQGAATLALAISQTLSVSI